MSQSAHVIDLNRYRTRRNAQRLAEAMWTLYAYRAGYVAAQIAQSSLPVRSQQA
jgi:hypothetical protein